MMHSCSAVRRRGALGALRASTYSATTYDGALLAKQECIRGIHCKVLRATGRSAPVPAINVSSTRRHSRPLRHQTNSTPKLRCSLHTTPSTYSYPHPTAHVQSSDPLPEQLRSVMRLFTNPVVVCTARDPRPGSPARAMTMSSFTSLTLLPPSPLVTFNVATPSRTLDALSAAGEFAIHVLSGDARGAVVADHFTRGNNDHAEDGGSVFDGLEVAVDDAGGAPTLQGRGVLYVLRCRLAVGDAPQGALVRVRDHVVVVGEVVEVLRGEGVEEDEFALAYADRRYREVGASLTKR